MRSGRFKIVVACLAMTTWMGACADIFGITGGVLQDGGAGADSGASDVGPDVPFDGGYVNPDANYADCGMGARTIAVDAGIFVSQYGQGTACTIDAPCASITAALAVAHAGDTIYVAPGTYTATLEIGSSNVASTIEGGWMITDAGWVPQCDNTVAVIQRDPADSAEWAVHFNNAQAFTLRLVKIVNSAPSSADAGTSVYGVLSNNTPLTLDNVSIDVGDGIPGANGDPGFGDIYNSCSNPPPPSDGVGGGAGGSGLPGALTATATGWVSSQATQGVPGDAGDNGTSGGPAGSCLSCVTCELQCDGGGGCEMVSQPSQCPTAGAPGCGGGGGFAGFGAGSGYVTAQNGNGGSSVALYAWGNSVTFVNVVTLVAGNGGRGGNGGLGADGGMGSAGTAGSSATCNTGATCNVGSVCPNDYVACYMGSTYTISTNNGGTAGGPGGLGGNGGQGGGGAGAFSYGYFNGFNATIGGSSPVFQYGTPGQGGLPNGPNGSSAQHN